jgi:hypothetical protein
MTDEAFLRDLFHVPDWPTFAEPVLCGAALLAVAAYDFLTAEY